jgi:surface antigen Omp85-like protein
MHWLVSLTLVLSASTAAAEIIVVPQDPSSAQEPVGIEAAPVPAPAPAPAPAPVAAPTPAPEPPAPRPDKASGIEVDDQPRTSRAIWIPRALLFFPRMAFWLAVQPIRGITYVHERYGIVQRLSDATFTDDGRFGIYPVAGYESGFGFKIGARIVAKDIFGKKERLKLRADWGGEFRYAVGAHASTGRRLGPISFEADSSIERRPRERFYGIGNGRDLDDPLPTPIDPSLSEVSLPSRFREDVIRNVATIDIAFMDQLHSRLSGALMLREFSAGEDEDITTRFDTSKLIGFETGVKNVYVENELIWDSRRPATDYGTQTLDGSGWLARGHFGINRGVEDDPSKFYAYGGELQRYFDLYQGNRTLTVRALFDAVGGTDGRTDGKISFIDLPRLGGSEFLRGYPSGRFRDKAVALATVEYTWAIMNNSAAFTFIDVGQPLASFEDVTSQKVRFGYGMGLQLHTRNTFFMRAQLAFSRVGDIALNLVFSPAFGRRERAGRF